MSLWLVAGIILSLTGQSVPARVLVLSLNIKSHILYHGKVARLLADEGHLVDFVLASNVAVPDVLRKDTNVRLVRYNLTQTVDKEDVARRLFKFAMSESTLAKIRQLVSIMRISMTFCDEECRLLLRDSELRRHVDNTRYDLTIVDMLGIRCFGSLVHGRQTHLAILGVLAFEWPLYIPSLPSFVPSKLVQFDDGMSFWERFLNTLAFAGGYLSFSVFNRFEVLGTDRPVFVDEVLRRTDLYFVLDDPSVSTPRPLMPNIVYVGDAVPAAGRPLPRHLAEFVGGATDGVILVSFGSYSEPPPELVGRMCSAFRRIPQKVIWKLKDKALCRADEDRVLTMDWLPQNDLLSHPNVRLFVSHCGINGILESIYHSTPILGLPIGIDQPHNAKRLQRLGLGYTMRISSFSVEEMVSRIAAILADEAVRRSVERASFLLRNKPEAPSKRLSYWVEHVSAHGADHLRTKAVDLTVFQFFCLDVLLVLLAAAVLTFSFGFVLLRAMFRRLRRACVSKKAKAE